MAYILKLLISASIALIVAIFLASLPPRDFPVGEKIHIPENFSLTAVSNLLAKKDAIRSPFLFKAIVTLLHGQGGIIAGDYLLKKSENVWTISRRVTEGDQQIDPIKVTIPEGSTVNDIAWVLLKKIPDFNAPHFVSIAHSYEGYLFPDTYLFYPNTSPAEMVKKMRKTFDVKFKNISKDTVIMASIIEKEVSKYEDREIISGILWKRLKEGMLLQVDVAIETYKEKGLPKFPIANPGTLAIKAAENPVKTKYYYYLSDKEGVTHYAVTYDGHKANINKYLR